MHQARRREAADRSTRTAEDRDHRLESDIAEDAIRPEGTGRLVGGKEQGIYRYFLAGKRIQNRMAVEFFVSETVGWIRGEFSWSRKPKTPPSILVPVFDPEGGKKGKSLGVAEVELPRNAVCRWPVE